MIAKRRQCGVILSRSILPNMMCSAMLRNCCSTRWLVTPANTIKMCYGKQTIDLLLVGSLRLHVAIDKHREQLGLALMATMPLTILSGNSQPQSKVNSLQR